MQVCAVRGGLSCAALLDVLVFLLSASAAAGIFSANKAPASLGMMPADSADLGHGDSSLLFLQLRQPRPHSAGAAPGLPQRSESSLSPLAAATADPGGSRFDISDNNVALLGLSATSIQRPQVAAGSPDPDMVYFSLYGKTFYGIDLKTSTYTIDIVLTMQWMDPRASSVVPAGAEVFTLSNSEAILGGFHGKVWTPGVEITNAAGQKFDRISSSITIAKDGKVTQVERVIAAIQNKFILNDYPFDTQTLRLNVESTQYMLNEVKLAPMGGSGCHENFFDGEDYQERDFAVRVYKDINGPLKKSRGSMEMVVTRSLARFQRNFLLPALIYMAIACGVFWLPFSATFVTPRLALSIFILLIFSTLAGSADNELPEGAPYNWIDLLCFMIELHMFTMVCFNIFTEIVYHSLKCTVTAVHVSHEMKMIAPLTGGMSMAVVLAASMNPVGPLGLHSMRVLVPVGYLFFLLSYMTCCGSTLSAERARNKRAEANKAMYGEPEGGGLGPLASSESLAPRP